MIEYADIQNVPLRLGPIETALHVLSWDLGFGNQLPGTIIYAGRFDPPTRAHGAVLHALDHFAQLRTAEAQGFWQVVVWPHEAYGEKEVHAPEAVRKEWMQLLVRGLQVTSVHDVWTQAASALPYVPQIEMYRAYRTMQLVAPDGERYTVPVNVIQVIGADNVPYVSSWEEPEELEKRNWLIVPRAGVGLPSELPPHAHILGAGYRSQAGSASEVREMIAVQDESWRALVLPGVEQDIVKHALYGYRT